MKTRTALLPDTSAQVLTLLRFNDVSATYLLTGAGVHQLIECSIDEKYTDFVERIKFVGTAVGCHVCTADREVVVLDVNKFGGTV